MSAWQDAPIVDDAEATTRAAAWEDAPVVEGEAASWEQAPIVEDAGGPITRAARRAAESAALPTGERTDAEVFEPRQPEARDLSTGFFNNLSLRDIHRTMRERGAAPSLVRYFMGNTEKEQERRKKLAGMDVDPIDREFGEAVEAAYQAGGYESPDFQKIEAAHKEYLKARDNPEFRWSDLKAAFAQDPGGMAAEFVKTVIADPELLLTPLGWGRAATAAGTAAKAAGAGRALTQTARAAGGFTGAAATGAAVTAPVSVAQQLGESGTVDASRLGGETALGAAGSATAGGTLVGAAAAIKRLRALRTRPNVDAGQVDAEMQRLQDAAVQEARNAGMTPEQAQAELSRLLDDPALRETAPDATQTPEWARAPEVEGSGRPDDVEISRRQIDEAADEAATSPRNDLPEPTEAQKEAGNYRKAHIRLHGLDISIENPAGSRRRPEWSPLTRHYGYIKGTRGRDKDHLDVFIGENAADPSLPVFVIDQVDPRTGHFDEHKIHLGEPNKQAARDAYLSNYEPGWKGLGAITQFTLDEFKGWLERGDTTKPLTLKPGSKVGDRSAGAAEARDITPQTRLGDAVDAITEPLGKLGKEVADVSGAKAITYLDELARVSPAAKKLRDTIEYTEFSREPLPPSFYERVSLKTGEYMSAVENTLDSVRGTFRRKLPGDINAKLAGALRGERVGGPVSEAAQRIRVVLNKVRDYARESGLEIGFIKNYFPRVYKKRVLESEPGRTAFTKVLMRHGIEATEADLIAQKIANNDGILALERAPASERVNPTRPAETTSFEPGRLGVQKARINRNLETGRTLARIPDTELAPFLEGNVPAVLNRYITHAVRRAEYARAFGPGEGRLNRMVRDIIVEAAQAGRPVRPAEIQRIYDLADALQQSYRPILSGTGRAANNFVTAYQYMRTLSLATISSLSEPFLVIARGRPGTIPRAIARSLNHAVRESVRSVYRRLPKTEATKALEDVGLGLDAALTERLTASFGGEVTKFTSAYFKLNFLHQFTRFNRVLANEAGKLMVERHLRDLARGVSTRRAAQITRELAELGVDAEAGQAWVKRGARPGDAFYERVKAAGLRFTNEVVMNPRPTNRPMWMSNPHFHLLAQLKGFQTVFGNTVLKRLYDMLLRRGAYEGVRNAAKIAAAGTLMVYTAMLGNEFREIIKYGPGGNPRFRDETPARKVYRAMERAGFLGVFQFASDAMFAHRFGSPAVSQLAGPTVSQVNEIIEATGKAAGGNMRPLAREAANAAPIVNVVPAVRHAITDAIAPKTRRDSRRERR